MKRRMSAWVIAATLFGALPAIAADAAATPVAVSATDSGQLEKSLQSLNWPQFRSVVEAIPKLKADVDAYGPLGWQYVEANYRTYHWKKNIDKLDDDQRRQLAALIQSARRSR